MLSAEQKPYRNPFVVLLEAGKDLGPEDRGTAALVTAAQELGGLAVGEKEMRNLFGLADETAKRQVHTEEGEL